MLNLRHALRTRRPARTEPAVSRAITLPLLGLAALLLALAGCDDTHAPETSSGDAEYSGSYDPDGTALEFAVESADGSDSELRLFASNIVWAPGSGILRAQVALRNVGNTSVRGPDGVVVFDFVPADVHPIEAACVPLDVPTPPEVRCTFDHRGTYGDDGRLAPGETSEPVEWQFQNTAGVSFAFRARLANLSPTDGTISGVVFNDLNRNGQREANEPGIPDVGIGLELDDVVVIRKTNAQGRFAFTVDRPGLYRLIKSNPEGWFSTTPAEMHVLIIRGPNGDLSTFARANFGCARLVEPELSVVGSVFHDLDRNGVRDADEPGIAGVLLTASGLLCLGPGAALARSDSSGAFTLQGADVGCTLPWLVLRDQVAGMIGTTPTHVVFDDPPPGGSNTFRVDFGLATPDVGEPRAWLTIEGSVFNDANGNGERDANEAPVVGAQVQLVSPCEVLRMTYTDGRGTYVFGDYETRVCSIDGVWLAAPRFKDHTTPNPHLLQAPTVPGLHLLRVDFGVR